MKTATTTKPEDDMRVLKVGTCPSLTGKSTLKYHVGCNSRSELHIRVHSNTGGGFFNRDWVSVEGIKQQLDKGKPEEPITSHALYPIFRGRSANTPGYLFAVIRHEGFVQAMKEKKRCFERLEPKAFLAETKALIASKVALVPAAPVAIEKPKAAAGKAAAATKAKPATPAKAVIRGKQYNGGKAPAVKGKRK